MTTTTDVAVTTDALIRPIIASRHMTNKILEAIPEDKWLDQPFDGFNHVWWNVGHIATCDDYFLKVLFDAPSKMEAWYELFGPGSKPSADGAGYPSPAELRDAMSARHEDLLNAFRALDNDGWAKALPEDWQEFSPTYRELPGVIAWHEGMHAGQLTVARKALGGEPVMM